MEQLLALEMIRVTEAAAIESARFMGRGEKDAADAAATEAMRRTMDEIDFAGRIVIGEGERDEAPMLYIGERVGRTGADRDDVPRVDIAVDPLEGTNLVAHGQAGAITVLAASEAGGLTHAPDTYMEKLCVGPVAAGQVDIRDDARPRTSSRIAEALGRQGRRHHGGHPRTPAPRRRSSPRSAQAGARIKLIGDGDLSAAISCAVSGTGVHAVMGTGGAPEGVITAAALRCLGGEIQARFRYRSDDERERGARMGHGDEDRVYLTEDLAPGREPRLRRDRRHRRRPPPGRPLLRWRGADPFARDGLPGQAGPLRRHRPHVRSRQPAAGPALGQTMRLTGYKASAEQFPPRRLLDLAVAAERAGFDSVWTSDHFQPWRHTDGHAPNALVWLGAAAQATERVTLGTSVLTPSFRYNPAVVAQAFATLGCLAPGRVILGVGTGESMNEIPVGIEWPEQSERFARLKEVGDADPAAVPRGLRHLRGRVLPDPQRDDLRPARRAGPDLHRGVRTGRRAARRADRRRVHLHLGQGRGPLHRDAPAGGRSRAAEKAGTAIRAARADDRDEGQLRHRPRPGDGGHEGLGGAGALRASRRWASTTRARWSAWPRASRTSPTGAGWCRPTPTSTSSRSRPTSATASTTWSSTSPGNDQEAAIARYGELILPRLRARFG